MWKGVVGTLWQYILEIVTWGVHLLCYCRRDQSCQVHGKIVYLYVILSCESICDFLVWLYIFLFCLGWDGRLRSFTCIIKVSKVLSIDNCCNVILTVIGWVFIRDGRLGLFYCLGWIRNWNFCWFKITIEHRSHLSDRAGLGKCMKLLVCHTCCKLWFIELCVYTWFKWSVVCKNR